MDRLVRARVLLAEAEALGVTIDDLVAAASFSSSLSSSGRGSGPAAPVPTLAEYVDTVAPSFSANTAATYRSYWRVAVACFGDRPIDSLDADDREAVLTDAVRRAQQRRPGSDGRSSWENCIAGSGLQGQLPDDHQAPDVRAEPAAHRGPATVGTTASAATGGSGRRPGCPRWVRAPAGLYGTRPRDPRRGGAVRRRRAGGRA